MIDALNEKNRLLEKQEDLLYEEHDKFVSVQKCLALEVKRNEMLSCELSTCHESISSLKSVNDDLNAKLEVANKSSSCIEHVVICNRCKDFNVDACVEHLTSIAKLNDARVFNAIHTAANISSNATKGNMPLYRNRVESEWMSIRGKSSQDVS